MGCLRWTRMQKRSAQVFSPLVKPYTPEHRQAYFSIRTLRQHDMGDSKRGGVLSRHSNYIVGLIASSSGRSFLLAEQGWIGLGPPGNSLGRPHLCTVHSRCTICSTYEGREKCLSAFS